MNPSRHRANDEMISKYRFKTSEFEPAGIRLNRDRLIQVVHLRAQDFIGPGISRFHEEYEARNGPGEKREHEREADDSVKAANHHRSLR